MCGCDNFVKCHFFQGQHTAPPLCVQFISITIRESWRRVRPNEFPLMAHTSTTVELWKRCDCSSRSFCDDELAENATRNAHAKRDLALSATHHCTSGGLLAPRRQKIKKELGAQSSETRLGTHHTPHTQIRTEPNPSEVSLQEPGFFGGH